MTTKPEIPADKPIDSFDSLDEAVKAHLVEAVAILINTLDHYATTHMDADVKDILSALDTDTVKPQAIASWQTSHTGRYWARQAARRFIALLDVYGLRIRGNVSAIGKLIDEWRTIPARQAYNEDEIGQVTMKVEELQGTK